MTTQPRIVRAPILDVAHHISLEEISQRKAARQFFASNAAPFGYPTFVELTRQYLSGIESWKIRAKIEDIPFKLAQDSFRSAFVALMDAFPSVGFPTFKAKQKTLLFRPDIGAKIAPTCFFKENGSWVILVQQPRSNYLGSELALRFIATAMHIRYVTTREIRADKISICDLRKLNGGPRISRRIDFSPSDLLSENEMKPLLSRYAETIDALVAEGHNVSFRKPKPNQQADIFGD